MGSMSTYTGKLGSEWRKSWVGRSEGWVSQEGGEKFETPNKSKFRGKLKVAIRIKDCDIQILIFSARSRGLEGSYTHYFL